MIPGVATGAHDGDLTAQHYHAQHHPSQISQQYQGYSCTTGGVPAVAPPNDFPTSYGPMYSSYMKYRTNPYQRPPNNNTTAAAPSGAGSGASPNTLPTPAMYYPGFSNAAAAAAAAAAGLYSRQHNMYDYTGMHSNHAEVPR